MISEQYYCAEPVSSRITAIRSRTGEILYLIRGREKAALIDTCLGVGNLRGFVSGLTSLPLIVLLTHGHVDHAMGAPDFETVYMNPADEELYRRHSPLEERQGFIEANLHAEPGSWRDADYVPPADPNFRTLIDGDCFDLGGIILEVYALPGHTRGSMVVLIPEERILITGDAANNSLFLFDEDASSVETYRENVLALLEKVRGRYDRCFMMHHDMEASGQLLEHMVQVCDDILAGKDDAAPFRFRGKQYLLAKQTAPGFRRLDGGEGNIIYNPEKITKRQETGGTA